MTFVFYVFKQYYLLIYVVQGVSNKWTDRPKKEQSYHNMSVNRFQYQNINQLMMFYFFNQENMFLSLCA